MPPAPKLDANCAGQGRLFEVEEYSSCGCGVKNMGIRPSKVDRGQVWAVLGLKLGYVGPNTSGLGTRAHSHVLRPWARPLPCLYMRAGIKLLRLLRYTNRPMQHGVASDFA